MGVTTWPCPGCSQQQRQEHQNGEAQENTLCAACEEKWEKAFNEHYNEALQALRNEEISEKEFYARLEAFRQATREEAESAQTL